MGKQKSAKRKRSNVSEVEERERVKESILKVFRARLTSPSKGGALLVGESKQTEKGDESVPKDTMSGRWSRPKRKSSRQKRALNKKSPVTLQPETAVTKHLKVAHGIVNNRKKDTDDGSLINRIAPSRLTHKLGIFGAGKKSKTATRGLMLPDHIQRRTEADIHKVYQEVDPSNVSMDSTLEDSSLVISKPADISSSTSHNSVGLMTDKKTPNAKYGSSVVSSKAAYRSSSVECSMESDLGPLDLKDTIHEMMLTLGPLLKQLCPGRDYLKETTSHLQKLMKQNAPRSTTPTPIPVLNKIRSSGGIQRSLFGETGYQRPSETIKPPGLDSAVSFQNTARKAFSLSPLTSKPVSYPTVHVYDKTNKLQTEPGYNTTHTLSDMRKGNHDIHYYRSKVLGTERRDSLNMGTSKDLILSPKTKDSAHSWSCLQHTRMNTTLGRSDCRSETFPYHNNEGRNEGFLRSKSETFPYQRDESKSQIIPDCYEGGKEPFQYSGSEAGETCLYGKNNGKIETFPYNSNENRNDTFPYKNSDRQFVVQSDHCMIPDDEFSAFFKDFSVKQKNSSKRRSTPLVVEPQLKITKPISPLLDHEAVLMLRANDDVQEAKQQFEPMDCETRLGDALNLLEKNDLMQSINEERKSQEIDCLCRDVREHSQGCNGSTLHNSQNKVMYMPGFHSDYYTDYLCLKDILWQKTDLPTKVETMDILDHLDLDTRMDVQQNTRHRDVYQSIGQGDVQQSTRQRDLDQNMGQKDVQQNTRHRDVYQNIRQGGVQQNSRQEYQGEVNDILQAAAIINPFPGTKF